MPDPGGNNVGGKDSEFTPAPARLVQAAGNLEAGVKAHGQSTGGQLASGISGRVADLLSFTKNAVEGAAEREKGEHRVLGGLGEFVAGLGRLIRHIPGLGSVGDSLAKWGKAVFDEQSKHAGAASGRMKASTAGWRQTLRPMLMSEQAERAEAEATAAALRGVVKSGLTAETPGHIPTDADVEIRLAEQMRKRGMTYRPTAPMPRFPGAAGNQRPGDKAEMAEGLTGIASALALPGAMPGSIASPGPAGMPGRPAAAAGGGFAIASSAEERAADALETYLPIIAENTRKEPRAPYQVTQ